MFNKLKEVKDKIATAKRLMDLQKRMSEITVEGTSGWGKVKISVNGLQKAQACLIDPDVLSDGKKLQGLIVDAINDAHSKLQKVMAEKMKETGSGGFSEEFGDLLNQG